MKDILTSQVYPNHYFFSAAELLSAKYFFIASIALNLCEILFLIYFGSYAYVLSYPSGSKTGSHPKSLLPLGSTIFPGVLPIKSSGYFSSGDIKAIIHMA